ncbi:hypothetical protein SAMN05660690_1923 [Geodermatophilus telluris]|uniref:Uncharacterized protein n=1 Tax=Geodermatophilus telluris TaxID=1190417 RepID=A0A1G6MLJ8_9ACTN|nr:hypothetical protein [Geodermatophilus telluris]SDC56423.1 hypothetical protein SAMN05660690_1923 [Geodermatophilus telluris]
MGALVFFEDNGCRGDVVGVWSEDDDPPVIRFNRTPGFRNDEARSLRIVDLPANTTIRLYDDSSGRRSDDWVEITTRRHIREYGVHSFERSYEDSSVRVRYHPRDDLDGKVSRAEIDVTGVLPNPPLTPG